MRTQIALVALLPLLATGCSSGSSTSARAEIDASASPSTAATSRVASPAAVPGAPTTTPSSGSVGAGARGITSSAPTVPARPITTVAPGKVDAAKATAPGKYTLDVSGFVSSPGFGKQDAKGTQTLTFSALRNGGQHSNVHGDQGDTDQDLLVRDRGTYLAALKLTSPAFNGGKEFRPSPAALLVPEPAKVGTAWVWGATSTDGKTKAKATNRVARNESVTVGGRKVPCVVITTHLQVSGDVTYDAQLTTWYSPSYHLPVKDHTVGNGTASFNGAPITFKTDISTLMRSVTPA
ncbi:MAG: hypothetical protein JWO12_1486 [Frankiales bacterium]|nr:hypothetical protein [Frankiales bacterium]